MSGQTDRFQVLRKLPKIRFDEELRGYSRNQVDRVLHSLAPLADEVDQLQARLNEAETRAASAEAQLATQPEAAPVAEAAPAAPATPADFDETLRNTLLLAQRTADQTVKDANAEAERLVAEAQATAAQLAEAGRREADEIQATNSTERDRLDAELTEERTRRLAEIAASSSERLAAIESELEAAHDEQRQQLLADIAELERRRSELNDDIERFESHLATRREAVRSAIAELGRVADGDHGLHGEMPPEPAVIDVTDPAEFAPVQVSSPALDELDGELAADAPAAIQADASDGPAADEAATPIVDDEAVEAAVDEVDEDEQPVDLEALLSEDSGAADETYGADELLGGSDADAGSADEGPDTAASSEPAPIDESDDAYTSGIMLGEVDAGPAPDAAGPATEAVDVLDLDDDAERHSWDVPEGGLDDAADEAPSVEASAPAPAAATPDAPSFDAPSFDASSFDAAADEAPSFETGQQALGLADELPVRPAGGDAAPPIERPQWADDVPSAADAPTPPSDPFLEELRRVTEDEDTDDDALARFLESDPGDDESNKGGGWFGRRK